MNSEANYHTDRYKWRVVTLYNELPCRPSSLLCLKICLVDQVGVLGIEVNSTLVVGGRTSPWRVGGTGEIWETAQSH